MYKLCKTEQSASRQRQLELGLLEYMQTVRYEDISISDLCQHLQVPRKSFYRYFSSKDGALFALLDHTMLEFYEKGYPELSGGTALGDLSHFFTFWYTHRSLLDALERSQLSGILVERATVLAQRERLMPRQMLNWSQDIQDVAMSFAICGLMSMVIQWHHQQYRISPEEMTKLAVSMLTKPLIHGDRNGRNILGG